MSLPPRQFVRLFDRRYRAPDGSPLNYAVVGFLPLYLGAHMPTLSPEIRLEQEYARKIIVKHFLKWDDLSVIGEIIDDSYCFREKPKHLTFMGYCREQRDAYTLVLKSAQGGRETWVLTLHRTYQQQINSKVRRAREHNLLLREPLQPFEE